MQYHHALADLFSHGFFFSCLFFFLTYIKVTSKSSQQYTWDPKPWPLQKLPAGYKAVQAGKCYLKHKYLNTFSLFVKSFSLFCFGHSITLHHFPYVLPLKPFKTQWDLPPVELTEKKNTLTSRDENVSTLPKVFNTTIFIRHRPTKGKKIFTFSAHSMYKKDRVKL